NTFETLVHIILEQQVSLASALAALNKLKEKIQEITPVGVLQLTDEELRTCYFSRQKTIYVRCLAEAISSGQIDLMAFADMPDEEIRTKLITLKGIGHWTVDIYLIFVLQRTDIFPGGDLAAVNAMKKIKGIPAGTSKEDILMLTNAWQPYRTIATMLLWHYYLASRAAVTSKKV
ncbi:MAG: DNA-3-methyladenine glycosylase 2 family protein, partial [Sphingobacteriaceae bacterium]